MTELEVNLEVDNVDKDEIAKLTQEQIVEQFHKKGHITEDGWVNEEGELTPRFKQKARMGMTMEDEYHIDMWVKQMRRDFPNVDAALCDLVATHCYLHGEEAQKFVKEKTENPVKKDHEAYYKKIQEEHPELEREDN